MTRRQRRVHALVWPVLALVLAGVIFAGLSERARVVDAAAAVETG
ncbi:MAG: hypothetical protein Q8L84_02635 [Hyphomonas sp.]|nr:hypothetical protein [Hyphomonas sp.]